MLGMRRLFATVFVSVLVLAACGGDDNDDVAAENTTTPTTVTADPTTTVPTEDTTAPCEPLEGGSTDATAAEGASAAAYLTDVQLTTGDCTDVVTFTFADSAPGYEIAYQAGPITQDGSGEPVDVAGSAFLVVRFSPAYGYNFDTGTSTYTGPDHITSPGAFFVRDVAKTGDFEAVVSWVIGVDQQRPFVVSNDDPASVSIAIR
jgi:hypothetical protein